MCGSKIYCGIDFYWFRGLMFFWLFTLALQRHCLNAGNPFLFNPLFFNVFPHRLHVGLKLIVSDILTDAICGILFVRTLPTSLSVWNS